VEPDQVDTCRKLLDESTTGKTIYLPEDLVGVDAGGHCHLGVRLPDGAKGPTSADRRPR
jgi:hypothetical protein